MVPKGYHSLVPGLISISLEMVWVPIMLDFTLWSHIRVVWVIFRECWLDNINDMEFCNDHCCSGNDGVYV